MRYWEVIAPVGIVALGVLAFVAARLSHPAGDHHADPARLDATPDTLARWGTVPVKWTEGLPPWAAPEADRYSGYGWNSGSSGSSYGHTPWDADTEQVEAWVRDGMQVTWTDDSLPPELEATLRRELHHVDLIEPARPDYLGPGAGMTDTGYNSHLPSGTTPVKVDSPAPAGLPREDGAGDESEGSGLTAPPAPLWEYRAQNPGLAGGVVQLPPLTATGLALARCDLFMAAMVADHERWLSSARERWAA